MKIGLIDVDGHHFPNLALMRISAYHKKMGDAVEWWLGDLWHYDLVYMSKVFSDAYTKEPFEPVNVGKIIKGGSGYCIGLENGKEVFDESKNQPLPDYIEKQRPDYSIYPKHGFAVSMTTRGCPRGCPFCHVSKKEGRRSQKVANVSDFWNGQKEIEVLDPNILACPDRVDLLEQYAETKALVNFNQGLDIRLMSGQCLDIINGMRIKNIHFAWDDPNDDLSDKFKLYAENAKHKPKGAYAAVYCLCNFNSTLEQDLERIYLLRDLGFDPYVMLYDKPNADRKHKQLQRWCNNRFIFKTTKRFENYIS